MEIDLVYLWVDGSDPEWLKKKQQFTGMPSRSAETNTEGRYINNDELKYSLRSAEKYVPWVRQIFIVTDNQIPKWLNTNHPKVKVIDLTEIMPMEILPSFNSSVIEYHLYKIPDLTEHFLYANDDMFFNAPLTPDFFFARDGYPFLRLKRKALGRWHHKVTDLLGKNIGQYRRTVVDSIDLVYKKFRKYYSGVPHHNVDAYRKSNYQKAVEEVFNKEIEKSKLSRVRAFGDLNRSVFGYYALAIGNAHLKHVGSGQSMRILTNRYDFMNYLKKYKPELFCLNDSEHGTAEHREKIVPFLEKLFPDKSAFEK
jgi:hypothetical protein